MAKPSYAYAVGNIRAREHTLLSRNDIEQLLAINNINDLISTLSDKGYTSSDNDVDSLISTQEDKLWEYLYSVVPDKELLTVFLIPNDFHNMKVVLKGTIRSKEYDNILLKSCEVDTSVIKKAVEQKKFYLLPDYMQKALSEAYEVLTKTRNVQSSDGILDKACMQKQLELASKSGSDILKKYFSADIFYKNMKIALRSAKAQKTADFLDDTICTMPQFSITALKSAVISGQDAVLDYMARLNVFDSGNMAESFKKSASCFEKAVDDYLMSIVRESKYVALGCEPVVAFLLARRAEFTAIRLIAFGIRAKKPVDETKERLRMLYE